MVRVAGLLVAACLAGVPVLARQQLPDATLRAGFLFNFARFTEWPAGTLGPGAPLSICVEHQVVFTALREAVTGKSIGNHPIVALRRADGQAEGRRCHVAYFGGAPEADTDRRFAALAQAHVFTVGDSAAALRDGAVAHFFIEKRRLRFAISLPNASRAGLTLSSRLLSVAVVHRTQ